MRHTVQVISFGYGHDQPPPELDVELDARRFRNPHHDPGMRELTGHDAPVRAHVLATPGVEEALAAAVAQVRDLLAGDAGRVRIGVGCVGGRHRSVAMATEIAGRLGEDLTVTTDHRDVHRPVIRN